MYALSAMRLSEHGQQVGHEPRILPAAVRSCLADAAAVSAAVGTTNFIWLFPLVRFVANANEVTVEGERG